MKTPLLLLLLFYFNTSFCQGLTIDNTKRHQNDFFTSIAIKSAPSLIKIKSTQAKPNTWPQTFLAISSLSFVMGTVSAFDKGINSKATIGFYSISIISASAFIITIHKKKKQRINRSNR